MINAELHKAAGTRHVVIPGDPPLSVVMDLYIDHAKTLRIPDTAVYHALHTGP